MTDKYLNIEAVVESIGHEAMNALRLNSVAVSVSTVAGSRDAFRKRCAVLLSDIELPDLLQLLSGTDCGHWKTPDEGVTLEQAVRFAVLGKVDQAFHARRIGYCFEWAEGDLFSTLEKCADAARKVVSVRASRDIASDGKSIEQFLARVRHLGRVPDFDDLYQILVSKSSMFRPVVNDQWADWATLRSKDVDKPYLFELMTRLANYACLHNESRSRFVELVTDEATPVNSRASA
ncbi:hypothetical protein G6L37_06810 [Agrobacterium rubi]|nr:hypothetical protein [Agrobacterium rubi]NTF25075.1 hypothetical protein [Agrobacterium rubi]